MNRVYVNLTDEQLAGLKVRAKRSGAPIAEEIRRAVDAGLHWQHVVSVAQVAKNKKAQEIIAATGGPSVAPHWTEDETILSEELAQEIAQKIGKPIEELYERVPAQKSSAEVQLFTDRKESE